MLKSIRRFFYYLSQEAPDNPTPTPQLQMQQAGPTQQLGQGGYNQISTALHWPAHFSTQSIGI